MNCLICGSSFVVDNKYKKCCSLVCVQYYFQNKTNLDNIKLIKCIGCDKLFARSKKNLYYCSNICKSRKRKVKEIKCKNCNTIFAVNKYNKKHCSTSCRIEYKRVAKRLLDNEPATPGVIKK